MIYQALGALKTILQQSFPWSSGEICGILPSWKQNSGSPEANGQTLFTTYLPPPVHNRKCRALCGQGFGHGIRHKFYVRILATEKFEKPWSVWNLYLTGPSTTSGIGNFCSFPAPDTTEHSSKRIGDIHCYVLFVQPVTFKHSNGQARHLIKPRPL